MPTLSPAPVERIPLVCSDSAADATCSDLLVCTEAAALTPASAGTGTLVPA